MDVRKNFEEPKLLYHGQQQYMFFYHSSSHSVSTYYSNLKPHLGHDSMKHAGINALERTTSKRFKSLVLEKKSRCSSKLSVISDEDLDVKSDAESSLLHQHDFGTSDKDPCVHELLYDKEVIKKLKLLSMMVGVNCTEPGVVLTRVVGALKDLERRH